jgi:plasmid stability protein
MPMDTLVIQDLDEDTMSRLQRRAARHGRPVDVEAREILRGELAREDAAGPSLVEQIRARFAPLGGVELEIPPREPARDPPRFDP